MPQYRLTLGDDGESFLERVDRPLQLYGLGAAIAPTPNPKNEAAERAKAATVSKAELDARTAAFAGTQRTVSRQMKQAAIKVAAAQAAISLSIVVLESMVVIPVVGWIAAAVGAVLAVVSYFRNKHVKAEIASIMGALQRDVTAHQKAAQKQMQAAEDVAASAVLPAAQQLALSGAALPLEGLGDLGSLWTSITGAVKKAAKQTGKAVVQVHKVPAKAVLDVSMKAAAGAARTVGLKKTAAQIDRDRAHVDHAITIAAEHAERDMGDPQELAAELKRAAGMVDGGEQIRVAREGAAKIRTKAYAQIDAAKNNALAEFATPAYRDKLTVSLARAIRGDPSLLDEARAYQAAEKAAAVRAGLPSSTIDTTVPGSPAPLVGAAAAVAAFFLLRH